MDLRRNAVKTVEVDRIVALASVGHDLVERAVECLGTAECRDRDAAVIAADCEVLVAVAEVTIEAIARELAHIQAQLAAAEIGRQDGTGGFRCRAE